MRAGIFILVGCLFLEQPALAEGISRPAAPQGVVELAWSTQFANTLVSRCSDFVFKNSDPRLIAFMDALTDDGVDLDRALTVYAPLPDFTSESAKSLIEKSNISDVKLPRTNGACDLAELVFGSNMLSAAMLDRREPAEGS